MNIVVLVFSLQWPAKQNSGNILKSSSFNLKTGGPLSWKWLLIFHNRWHPYHKKGFRIINRWRKCVCNAESTMILEVTSLLVEQQILYMSWPIVPWTLTFFTWISIGLHLPTTCSNDQTQCDVWWLTDRSSIVINQSTDQLTGIQYLMQYLLPNVYVGLYYSRSRKGDPAWRALDVYNIRNSGSLILAFDFLGSGHYKEKKVRVLRLTLCIL